MNRTNKNILRGGLIVFYIFIIALITLGISSLYSYLNTGADRSTMLHTEQIQERYYIPIIEWDTTSIKGRPLDATTLKSIEEDYLNAWYVRARALKNNTLTGIEDYYTASATTKVTELINFNLSNQISVAMTSLEHHPKVEFFSEDGQLIVLTDTDVLEHEQLYKEGVFLNKTSSLNTYKIILLLEDGYWRIRQFVKVSSKDRLKELSSNPLNLNLKGINYYPKSSPWDTFGTQFNKDTIVTDFKIIKNAGLNSIRIFVGYEDFGKEHVSADKLEKLRVLLDQAQLADLKVLVTLFDFYGNYSVSDWTMTQQHLLQIVQTVKDHDALLGWDIKNEPDLDYSSRNKDVVESWLEHMIYRIKLIDDAHPITIGWSNTSSAAALVDQVDFVTFHYYEPLNELETALTELKTVTGLKKIAVTEYGVSSYSGIWNLMGSSEEGQANYHKEAQELLDKNKLAFMSWTLYDFESVPENVTGTYPWRRNPQKFYGFLDSRGKKKSSFKYISQH
ncbi:cellulase family glycosylhydrolase [Nonlabens ulvanivorans]|uniref:cellulase family glycosylhydrolase n=1 Tax=Nonlabens ulvanivorans TaxID=906888 RepID=UPI0029424B25|nr:cellulase family glycosylhydrolase [Nonlabens ulvanivorans]WOI22515.1 cellulase family glycosylhydrolase [Nonlabens ulvanivorans]